MADELPNFGDILTEHQNDMADTDARSSMSGALDVQPERHAEIGETGHGRR
jgi:hypothetical protein